MFLYTSWPLPRSQKAKESQRRGHRRALESLGMSLRPEKTQAGEIDFLGIHLLGPERFRAPETYGQAAAP